MRPGALVRLNSDRVMEKLAEDSLTLWKHAISTMKELRKVDSTISTGRVLPSEVGLVIARVHSLNGVMGTDTDSLLMLFGSKLGWAHVHWFLEIQTDR